MGVSPGLTQNFFLFGKSSKNRASANICLYALLKVVAYYDLSVLSTLVMGFQKKFGWRVGGWGDLSKFF